MRKWLLRVVPSLAALAGVIIFMRLGFWQLARGHEAAARKQAFERRVAQPPLQAQPGRWAVDAVLYRQVMVKGRYDARYQILLDNQFNHGAVGYDVLTPLHIAGSPERVLVDRGWVPFTGNHRQVPQVPVPEGEQQVLGLAVQPGIYFRLGKPQALHPWHVLWEYLDLKRYAEAVPFPVEPVELLLAPGGGSMLVRAWPNPGTGVRMHRGYALQWFLFAFTVVVVFVALNGPWRRRHER